MHFTSLIVFLTLTIFLVSCGLKGDKDIGTVLQPRKDNFGIYYTDTVTIQSSTVLLDSIVTSNTGYLLAGQYKDPRVGTVSASNYFNVGTDGVITIDENAVYDSLVLWLDYDEYNYGDTSKTQSLQVYRLQDEIPQEKTFYNFDKLPYKATPIGIKEFKARTLTKGLLRIKLSDEIGKEIFALGQKGQFSSNTSFREYFKGLALIPGSQDDAAIIRFNTSSDSTAVKLYYHLNNLDTEKTTLTLKMSEGGSYFNHFESDRSKTSLAPLQKTFSAISAANTYEETFIQGGIGLRTRIDFPYLRQLNELGNFAINKAELILQPVEKTFSDLSPLPKVLSLQEVNGSNWLLDPSKQIYVYLKQDYINNTSSYSCDLTTYVNSVIEENKPSRKGLLLSLEPSENQNTLQRIVLGSYTHTNYKATLQIYYTLVQKQNN